MIADVSAFLESIDNMTAGQMQKHLKNMARLISKETGLSWTKQQLDFRLLQTG